MTKILIVEDDDTQREYLDLNLHKRGYKTLLAKDGVEGLAALIQTKDVNIIILDHDMPRMNGSEFSKILKTEEAYFPWRTIPIIGHGNFEHGDDARYLFAHQQKIDGLDNLITLINKCENIFGKFFNPYKL